MDFSTPRKILNLYRDGFVGSICDPEDNARLMAELSTPVFGAAAYDLYGDRRFWWVFAQRNMNVLKDPVYDFVAGTKIYLPKERNISSELGS